ncbi:MAG: WD40 repeat domain-containing protein [Pirellulaceae bacterium]
MFNPTLQYQLTFEGLWPSAVSFLDSSHKVAAGNQKGEIYVWELPETPPEISAEEKEKNKERKAPNLNPVRRLEGHANAISWLIYDAARKQLISSSFDHTIRLWNVDATPTGTAEAILDGDTRKEQFRRTKKEEILKAPGVSVQTHDSSKTLEAHQDWIHALSMSRSGNRLISGDGASQVVVWDLDKNEPLSKWKGYSWNWIVAADLTADGQTALVSEYRYKRDDFDIPAAALKLWHTVDGTEKLDLLKVQFPKLNPQGRTYGDGQLWSKFVGVGLVAAAFSPDGKQVAVGQGGETDTGKVHLLETETGKLIKTVSGHQYGITAIAWSKDGLHLFTAGRDTCVRIIQVSDGKELAVLGSPRGGQFKDWISAISLSPDETHLAAADIAGHVAVWKLK